MKLVNLRCVERPARRIGLGRGSWRMIAWPIATRLEGAWHPRKRSSASSLYVQCGRVPFQWFACHGVSPFCRVPPGKAPAAMTAYAACRQRHSPGPPAPSVGATNQSDVTHLPAARYSVSLPDRGVGHVTRTCTFWRRRTCRPAMRASANRRLPEPPPLHLRYKAGQKDITYFISQAPHPKIDRARS